MIRKFRRTNFVRGYQTFEFEIDEADVPEGEVLDEDWASDECACGGLGTPENMVDSGLDLIDWKTEEIT